MKQLEVAALGQLAKMLEKDGGLMSSMEEVEITVDKTAGKAHRELIAQQCEKQKPTEARCQGGLKISPSTFNQRVTGDCQSERLDWGVDNGSMATDTPKLP
jgi:hypothetical protein